MVAVMALVKAKAARAVARTAAEEMARVASEWAEEEVKEARGGGVATWVEAAMVEGAAGAVTMVEDSAEAVMAVKAAAKAAEAVMVAAAMEALLVAHQAAEMTEVAVTGLVLQVAATVVVT